MGDAGYACPRCGGRVNSPGGGWAGYPDECDNPACKWTEGDHVPSAVDEMAKLVPLPCLGGCGATCPRMEDRPGGQRVITGAFVCGDCHTSLCGSMCGANPCKAKELMES